MKNNPAAGKEAGITDLQSQRWKGARAQAAPPSSDASISPRGGFIGGWVGFWFNPVAPFGLHWMRFLAGVLFLLWLLPLTSERHAFFSLNGWLDTEGHLAASRLREGPQFGWSIVYAAGKSAALFDVIWWGSITVLVLFTLGVATRVTAILTWVVVVSFLAAPAAQPDTDYLLGMLALYLMIGYVFLGQWGRALSPLERILGPHGTSLFAALRRKSDAAPPSHAANFSLRMLQVHFAIVMVTSALHKLQFADWWSGVAFWYPLHPPLQVTADSLQAERAGINSTLFFLSALGYVALAWQFTFPLFAFSRRCRPILLFGALGWLGSAFLYGEPIFGPSCALACLSYLTPQEWQWVTELVSRTLERNTEQGSGGRGQGSGVRSQESGIRGQAGASSR